MKKLILLLAFVTAGLFANAQVAGSAPKLDANARATKLTETIDKVTTLTAAEKPKVLAINLERTKAADANRTKNDKDQGAFSTEKTRIAQKWMSDLQAALTPDQFAKLKAYQAEQKKKGQPTGE